MHPSVVVDVVLVLVLLGALARGWSAGGLRIAGTLAGLVLGAVGTYLALPVVMAWIPEPGLRVAAAILLALALLGIGSAIGGGIARLLRRGVRAVRLGVLDRIAGLVASAAVFAFTVLLVGSSLSAIGASWLTPAVAGSRVVQAVERLTPSPVSAFAAQARGLVVDTGGAWIVDTVDPPAAPIEPPSDEADTAAVQAAVDRVARISGTAVECGTGVTGSGFVGAEDRIVTNAHVVAGVDEPVVELPGRTPAVGRVVYVDERADLAVVAVDGLGVRPLGAAATLAPGSAAVVAGHPYGGPLTTGAARVVTAGEQTLNAGAGVVTRDTYSLAATVRPGNSGGPVLTADGDVAGVVFGTARTVDDLGYAVTMAELAPVLELAPELTAAVDAGDCAA